MTAEDREDHYALLADSNGRLYCDVDREPWPCHAETLRRAAVVREVQRVERLDLRHAEPSTTA